MSIHLVIILVLFFQIGFFTYVFFFFGHLLCSVNVNILFYYFIWFWDVPLHFLKVSKFSDGKHFREFVCQVKFCLWVTAVYIVFWSVENELFFILYFSLKVTQEQQDDAKKVKTIWYTAEDSPSRSAESSATSEESVSYATSIVGGVVHRVPIVSS